MIRHELGVRAVWSNNAADRVGDAIDLPMWRPSRSLPMQTLHQARSMATFFELKRLWLWIFGRYGRSFCLRYWNKPHSLVVMDTKRVAGRWSQVLCYTVGGSKTHMVPRYVCLGSMGHQEPFFLHYERNYAYIMYTNHQSKGGTHCLNHRWCCSGLGKHMAPFSWGLNPYNAQMWWYLARIFMWH